MFLNIKRIVCLCLAVYGSPVFSLPVAAQETYPQPPVPKPSPILVEQGSLAEFHPPLGTYHFIVTWKGIRAARAEVTVEKEGDYYKLHTTAKTQRPIDAFYRFRYKGKSLIASDNVIPVKTETRRKKNRSEKRLSISIDEQGEIEAVETEFRRGRPRGTKTTKLKTEGFTLDPFSAALLARSLEWNPGVARQFDTFTGSGRYLITLSCTGKEEIKIRGAILQAWVVQPNIQRLDKPEKKSKLRSARIYISADDAREILMIKSSVAVGSVTLRLDKFTP